MDGGAQPGEGLLVARGARRGKRRTLSAAVTAAGSVPGDLRGCRRRVPAQAVLEPLQRGADHASARRSTAAIATDEARLDEALAAARAAAARVRVRPSVAEAVAAALARGRFRAGNRRVMSLADLRLFVRNTGGRLERHPLADLQFWHRGEARLALLAVAAVRRPAVDRAIGDRPARPGRHRLVVPALLSVGRRSSRAASCGTCRCGCSSSASRSSRWRSPTRTRRWSRSEVSYPGRRISMMIDASTSMRTPFTAAHLNRRAATDATFFTTVAAAERFVAAAHEGPLPRPDRAGRVRQRSVRDHAVHARLRQHPAQHLADRRSGRVLAVPRSGHDHRAGDRAEHRAVQGVRLPRRRPAT